MCEAGKAGPAVTSLRLKTQLKRENPALLRRASREQVFVHMCVAFLGTLPLATL